MNTGIPHRSLNKENYFLTCVGFDSCWGDYGVLARNRGPKTRNIRRYPHALHPYPESRPADLRRLRAGRFRQDSSSTDTASGKHFAVVGGISLLEPKNDPITGVKKTDGGPAPTVSFSYYINDNWAVELWGAADKFENKFKGRTTPAWARSSSSRSR